MRIQTDRHTGEGKCAAVAPSGRLNRIGRVYMSSIPIPHPIPEGRSASVFRLSFFLHVKLGERMDVTGSFSGLFSKDKCTYQVQEVE